MTWYMNEIQNDESCRTQEHHAGLYTQRVPELDLVVRCLSGSAWWNLELLRRKKSMYPEDPRSLPEWNFCTY